MRALRLLILLAAAGAPATLEAAPPSVTHLLPSGGQRGTQVELTLGGKPGTLPLSAWCNQSGVTLTVAEDGTKATAEIAADAAPGTCWIRFYNAEGTSALRPFVIGTLPELVETEPNNELAEAQTLPEPRMIVNGALSARGDVDGYRVALERGQTLVASLLGHRVLGSPMDALLQVVSPEGFVVAQDDDDQGFDPQLAFTAPRDGTYTVRVFAFPETPDSSIRLSSGDNYVYRLTLTVGPYLSHTVPLSLSAGTAQSVQAIGWNLDDDLRELPLETAADDESATAAHPRIGNTVPVGVVRMATAVEDERRAPGQAQPIELPVALTGHCAAPGEADEYEFHATKDQRLVFRVAARALGSPLDPVLTLLDADGKVVRQVDDPSRGEPDAVLEQTIERDGVYRIRVSDLHGTGSFRAFYQLTASAPEPDFTVELSDSAVVATAGKPLEITAKVLRSGGHRAPIELRVEGLPEGFQAEPVTDAPEGGDSGRDTGGDSGRDRSSRGRRDGSRGEQSSEVKLAVTPPADGEPYRGPFRIVARVAGTEHQRVARAPLGIAKETTPHLWLTVKPAP